jgi:hypothetical protein
MRSLMLIAAAGFLLTTGCDLKKKTTSTTPATGKAEDTTVTPGPGGGVVVAGGGGGGSGGAVQAVRGAVKRAVTMNDLNQIRIYIENASLASGRMPTVQETYQALQQEAPTIAALIDDRTITLHPARTREEVWAYETAALQNGGLMLTSQGVERVDAQTLRQRLGQ